MTGVDLSLDSVPVVVPIAFWPAIFALSCTKQPFGAEAGQLSVNLMLVTGLGEPGIDDAQQRREVGQVAGRGNPAAEQRGQLSGEKVDLCRASRAAQGDLELHRHENRRTSDAPANGLNVGP